jgi:Flp pilus assembly pilin Flp
MNTMLLKLYAKFQDLMNREEGQDLVEYALVLALITVGAVTILTGIGSKVVATLSAINSAL